jgi:hypothetical protein
MPKYRVQLKQGSRTIVNQVEAKSVQSVLDLFNSLTTMKVSEVLKIEFSDDTFPPIDDMVYYPFVKFMAKNDTSRKANQITLHNIKLTKNESDIDLKIKECIDIDGLKVDSTYCGLFKNSKLS